MLNDDPFAFFLDAASRLVTVIIAKRAFVERVRQYLPDTGRRPETVSLATDAVVVQVLRQPIGGLTPDD